MNIITSHIAAALARRRIFKPAAALRRRPSTRAVAAFSAAAALLLLQTPGLQARVTDNIHAKVTLRRDGNTTHFIVDNSELSPVTMTFDVSMMNLKCDVPLPYTATFKPGQSEAFTLAPVDTNAQWEYAYTNYYKIGSTTVQPDDFVYSLPYAPGSTYRVTQGFDGKFSHQGSNKYSIDWKMPVGTPVLAARGGMVVKVKDDSDRGGASMKYDAFNNYILILHEDGTLGHYCHLKKDGVKVAVGQMVKTGDVIALSGDTGFTSGPHLHFRVYRTISGRESESIPIRYRDAAGQAVTLVEGHNYKAPEEQTAQVSGRVAAR